MDLLKAFDTINHSFLHAKLKTYGFSLTFLRLMQNYLCKLFEETTINESFINWTEIMTGVLQGSILRPLLFNLECNLLVCINGSIKTICCYESCEMPLHADRK